MPDLFATAHDGSAALGHMAALPASLFWTDALADSLTAAAFISIALALVRLVRSRRDVAFGWMFWCFAAFLVACAMTHVMTIGILIAGANWLDAMIRVAVAGAGLTTAVALWRLLPRAAALPSAEKLRADNDQLAALVRERDAALQELRGQVAQRQAAEAALLQSQKLEAVGQLTGGIAHDFNNLLQAVAGNLELIARKPGDADRVVRWSASALDAVERGRTLTGQLLAFSRKQRLDVTSVRLGELVGGVRSLVERAVAPLGQVRVLPIDPTWNVQADSLQLELAILNLAFNARDAMPDGGVLTISAEQRSGIVAPDLPAGDYVALTLADSGVGMSPEVLARAAEPFFTTKEVGKGTGMGLSMAFGVLRQSGGSLQIESRPGEGTRVTLLLRVAAAQPRRAVDDDTRADTRFDLSGVRIALVDDDPQVRSTLTEMLVSAGATVEEADSGNAGLELVRRMTPHLLVVDFAMPGMSGADVIRAARAEWPALPALVVTGFADSDKLDTVAGPEVAVLRKPFETVELLRKVRLLVRD